MSTAEDRTLWRRLSVPSDVNSRRQNTVEETIRDHLMSTAEDRTL